MEDIHSENEKDYPGVALAYAASEKSREILCGACRRSLGNPWDEGQSLPCGLSGGSLERMDGRLRA